jgi:hypothetical protein
MVVKSYMLAESKHQYLCADALASASRSIAFSVRKKYRIFITSCILGCGLLTPERASSNGERGLWIPVVLCNLRDKVVYRRTHRARSRKELAWTFHKKVGIWKISCLSAEEENPCFSAAPLRFFPLSRLLACSYNFQISADYPPCRRLT